VLDQTITTQQQRIDYLNQLLKDTVEQRGKGDADLSTYGVPTFALDASQIGLEAFIKIIEVVKAIHTDKLARAEQAFAAL
jgi:hypothetical protein